MRKINNTSIENRALAVPPFISYRYKVKTGFIMIAGLNIQDALSEANRSLSYGVAVSANLEVWHKGAYKPV